MSDSFTKRFSRRILRSITICRQWIAYVAESSNRAERWGDFEGWLSTTILKKSPPDQAIPWMTYPVIRWLVCFLRPDMNLFEWGSGSSTVFFARRVGSVISIEHDRAWFETVEMKLAQAGCPNATVTCVEPDPVEVISPLLSDNTFALYRSSDARFEGQLFYRYARSILEYPNEHFDVIVVDGRARAACLALSVGKVKKGGVIILDNSERPEYARALSQFGEPQWTVTHFEGPGPQTIWPVFGRTTVLSKSY